MKKTKKYRKKFGGMDTPRNLGAAFGPRTEQNDIINIDTLVNRQRRLEAEEVANDAERILEIVNRIMPPNLTVLGIRAEHVQRNNNMLFVTLSGELYGLTNIHISFVIRDQNSDNLHITANIPREWVSQAYQENPVIHIYFNGRVGFQSSTAERAQFITPRDTVIPINRLVDGLSQVNGPNAHNALVGPIGQGIRADDLIRIFGRPNNPGRLPLGIQGPGGQLTQEQLHDIFRLFRNLLWTVRSDLEMQPLVNNIFNRTGQRGRLRGGTRKKQLRRSLKYINHKTRKPRKSKRFKKRN
jgi:hypothetical protein